MNKACKNGHNKKYYLRKNNTKIVDYIDYIRCDRCSELLEIEVPAMFEITINDLGNDILNISKSNEQ